MDDCSALNRTSMQYPSQWRPGMFKEEKGCENWRSWMTTRKVFPICNEATAPRNPPWFWQLPEPVSWLTKWDSYFQCRQIMVTRSIPIGEFSSLTAVSYASLHRLTDGLVHFEMVSCFVTQVSFKLMILLPQPPEGWDWTYAPPSHRGIALLNPSLPKVNLGHCSQLQCRSSS